MRLSFLPLRALVALTSVAAMAACDGANSPTQPGTDAATTPSLAILPGTTANGLANLEEFEVCKYGSSATFSYSVYNRGTSTTTTGTFSLNDGACTVVALFGGYGADVTVSETAPQSGFQLDRADVTVVGAGATTYSQTTPSVTELVAGTNGGGLRGALVEYYNVGIPYGGEGCTPGYWKQPHHFDSWPAPYQPTDLFSAYFENAFPGMTLLQVLSQGGGKLIALGRHTVAALLNSASSGVNYNLTTGQVVGSFNALFPSTRYGPLQDEFAGFNEQGCPLN